MSEKRAVVALVSGFGFSLAAGAGVVFGSVSIATNVAKFFVQRHKKAHSVTCAECKGEKFVQCATCNGLSAIDWNPSEKKSSGGLWKLTQCPTCNGRKVQRCLNCLGQGST